MQPRLLVTRFAPHAQVLAKQLELQGLFALAQPLLEVIPLDASGVFKQFINADFDIAIAVSGNAVKYTQLIAEFNWPECDYFAVGEATQQELQATCGFSVTAPRQGFNSEALLALPELKRVKDKSIVILRGKGGRDLLHKQLQERGAKVSFLESYQRVNVDLDGFTCVNNWQQALINGVIITSVEILNQLVKLVPSQYDAWLFSLAMYVPSERVRQHAYQLGFKQVYLLPSLNTKQIVSFFKELGSR